MPGIQEDGAVDVETFRKWVMRARELAAACNQREIADIYIGKAFAFSPSDPDGAWPHHCVRDIIEELANPDVEEAWRTQIMNNRGITVRLPTDGGEQERALAVRYDSDVQQIGDLWPRTATNLRRIAERYRSHGMQEDTQAELTQDFWR